MLHAKKIICVDINEYFIDYIKSNFPKEALRKFSFYVSSGNDLNGVKDCSCDLVFSMDSLVRVEKKFIYNYILFSMLLKMQHSQKPFYFTVKFHSFLYFIS